MSSNGQAPELASAGVFAYPAGHTVELHTHPTGQLIHAVSGVMRTTTPQGTWVLPPTRAMYVPADVTHTHHVIGKALMHTLDLRWPEATEAPRLLAVTPAAREIISALVHGRAHPDRVDAYLAVLLDQLQLADPIDLAVPSCADPLLKPLLDALLANPADTATLAQWGARLGASSRTLARRFHTEVGMSFDEWRRRARMARACELVSCGYTVQATAHAVGYASASAFVHAFRQLTGTTPLRAAGRNDT